MFEFISYQEAAPGEKYLGIATIKAFGKILLRYKVIPGKNGNFYAPPSYKIADQFVPAFLMDSRADEDAVKAIIKKGIAEGPKLDQDEEIPF